MTTRIEADHDSGHVVWRMGPGYARAVAEFIEDNTSPEDTAREDAEALRELARAVASRIVDNSARKLPHRKLS